MKTKMSLKRVRKNIKDNTYAVNYNLKHGSSYSTLMFLDALIYNYHRLNEMTSFDN
jgi:hypothetical protein